MASSKETTIVKKIQVDDRELKQFYRDFNNKNIIVKVSLDKNFQRSMESDLSSSIARGIEYGSLKGSKKLELQMKDTSQKVKRDLSNSLLRGIEESSRKGSVAFSQNMKKETASLNSTLDGFSKNLTSSLNKPMAIMSSFVSALGKNLQAMLISTLVSGVGNLVNYLVNANKEAAKLRKNLSYDLSLPKIGSIKESLNLSISVDSKMAEERLKELISSSPYYDDNKGSAANFLEVLNYLIEDNHKKFSQFKEIVDKLEQGETLQPLDFNTLEKIFNTNKSEKETKEIIDILKSIQGGGVLSVEKLSDSLNSFYLGEKNQDASKKIKKNDKDREETFSLLAEYDSSFARLYKEIFNFFGKLRDPTGGNPNLDYNSAMRDYENIALTTSSKVITSVDHLNRNLESIYPFIIKESDKENISEFLSQIKEAGTDYQETKSVDSYEKMAYLFDEASRYISNLSINDRERSAARAESLKETAGVGFDLNSLEEVESRMINIFQTIPQESMNSLNFDKMEEETRRIGEKWQEVFEKTEANPDLKLKIDSDALKEDISNLKRQISILEILENSLTEEQKILLEESKALLQKAENVKSKKNNNSDSYYSNSDYLASQYITEVSNSLANVLHGFARSTKSGIYSGISGGAQLTSSILKTTKIDPTGISGAVVGGITGIISGIGALWQSSIEKKMDAIILEDTKFLNEFNEVKDAEIKAYQDHVKELNEQFNKSKSVYDKMYSMGAIGGDAYNEAMGGLSSTVGSEIKDTNEKIQVAQLQKQMLDSYFARKQELEREQMEMRKWGVWDSSAYQDTTDRLGKIQGAISSIEGASSLVELEPFPRNAINYAYHGFEGYTNKPTLFMTSEFGQKEKVSITPSYRLSQGFDSMGHPAPLSNSYDSSFLRNSGSGGSGSSGGSIIVNNNITISGGGDLNTDELSAKLTQKIIASIKKEFSLGGYGGR